MFRFVDAIYLFNETGGAQRQPSGYMPPLRGWQCGGPAGRYKQDTANAVFLKWVNLILDYELDLQKRLLSRWRNGKEKNSSRHFKVPAAILAKEDSINRIQNVLFCGRILVSACTTIA
ncbi:MAG: hypothetical protein Q9P14_01240 [candidate division KSB1 bacterium]|nr:hypothetical protein [candidate division KSB1 bacterium]